MMVGNMLDKNQTGIDEEGKFASLSAQDFMEEMPSLIAQGTLYLMLSLITVAVIWGILGKSDVVVSATGILVPKGEIKEVQSDKSGVVIELLGRQGMKVREGDVLVRLDTSTRADIITQIEQIKEDLALKNNELDTKSELLNTNQNELRRTKDVIREQMNIKKNSLVVAKNSLARIKEQYDIRRKMYENDLISRLDLLKEEDALEQAETKITEISTEIETYRIESAQDVESIEAKILSTQLEYKQVKAAINDNRRKLSLLELQYKKESGASSGEYDYDVIRASVTGTISKMELKQTKGYVQTGDILFEIIPENQPLVAKIEIPNTGIGQMEKGLEVKLKYDGYPYQQFGIGSGRLTYISPDSVEKDEQEFVFEGLVELNEYQLYRKGDAYPLFPGLTCTAEVVVDEKVLISYVLDFFTGGD